MDIGTIIGVQWGVERLFIAQRNVPFSNVMELFAVSIIVLKSRMLFIVFTSDKVE